MNVEDEREDILRVVSFQVRLTKCGEHWKGVCPFCNSELFRVNPTKQFYFCFACKSGGGVETFRLRMKEIESVTQIH